MSLLCKPTLPDNLPVFLPRPPRRPHFSSPSNPLISQPYLTMADSQPETFTTLFNTLGLDHRLLKALRHLGFIYPMDVQSQALPLVLNEGKDLLICAETGSGKTLAFCIPLLEKIIRQAASTTAAEVTTTTTKAKKSKKSADKTAEEPPLCAPQVLLLLPTRELCVQTANVINSLLYYLGDAIPPPLILQSPTTGATAYAETCSLLLANPSIIIATPSSLPPYFTTTPAGPPALTLSAIHTLILDECDLLLSYGYAESLNTILSTTPKIMQSILCSATLNPAVVDLKKLVLHKPAVLTIKSEKKAGQLKQFYLKIKNRNDKLLVTYVFIKLGILKGKGIIFTSSTDESYMVKLFLEQVHIRSCVLNAEMPMKCRVDIVERFNRGEYNYLISTEVDVKEGKRKEQEEETAAKGESEEGAKEGEAKDVSLTMPSTDTDFGISRGIDFRGVTFIMNYSLPPTSELYTHRVGRTARGGASGVALSLVTEGEEGLLEEIQGCQPRMKLVTASDEMQATGQTEGAMQPGPLEFDMKEIEGFRYRVEDVSRAVTKKKIKETRAGELKAEILNSDRLSSYFEGNEKDLQMLQRDGGSGVGKVQEHMGHVPNYLLPKGMQVAKMEKRKKKRTKRGGTGKGGAGRNTGDDPLQVEGGGEEDEGSSGEKTKGKREADEDHVFLDQADGTGRSTSGRKAWQQQHKKGKFSKRYTKSKQERGNHS